MCCFRPENSISFLGYGDLLLSQKHPFARGATASEKLELPLPEILTVMSVCNRAQLERARPRRVQVQRSIQRASIDQGKIPPLKKKFTVMLVTVFLFFSSSSLLCSQICFPDLRTGTLASLYHLLRYPHHAVRFI